jgi:hypothetical protein
VGLVEVYPLRRCLLDTVPIGIFKPGLCRQGNILELGKIRLKSIEYGARESLSSLHDSG